MKRYFGKLSHAEHRIDNLNNWIEDINFDTSEKTLLAIYKATQEIIESMMDLISMIIRDLKQKPRDDYSILICLANYLAYQKWKLTF